MTARDVVTVGVDPTTEAEAFGFAAVTEPVTKSDDLAGVRGAMVVKARSCGNGATWHAAIIRLPRTRPLVRAPRVRTRLLARRRQRGHRARRTASSARGSTDGASSGEPAEYRRHRLAVAERALSAAFSSKASLAIDRALVALEAAS